MLDREEYAAFLASKLPVHQGVGFDVPLSDLHQALFPWQRQLVKWALGKGRAALFADCGLGKTVMQLEWARQIQVYGRVERVLIVCPLNVSRQTIREAETILGISVHDLRAEPTDAPGIHIINYEQVGKIDVAIYGGVVLDESSILKSYSGARRTALIEVFAETPYKLACTATPAPNDHIELQSHAIFLGVPGCGEMLARWFVTDPTKAGSYRLKRHAIEDFWGWVCSWAASVQRPSDVGDFDDDGYVLPELRVVDDVVEVDEMVGRGDGELFRLAGTSATSMHSELRLTAADRAARVAALVAAEPEDSWVIWVHTDYEATAILDAVPGAEHLSGKDSDAESLRKLDGFEWGEIRVLVAKPRMCGFGLNWQHCRRMAFSGLSYSWEQMYQAIRRCWRFGQPAEVVVHIVHATTEAPVRAALERKRADHESMASAMVAAVRKALSAAKVGRPEIARRLYALGTDWTLWLGDSVEVVEEEVEDASVGLWVTSPPFSSLYTYSDALADMGNSAGDAEFLRHFGYLADAMRRKTMPGRICVLHCKELPRYIGSHGAQGIYDFPGDLVRAMEGAGWEYSSRVTIWKCPKEEVNKTNSHGLLHLQLCKDSTLSRQGLPDYLLVFRRWDGAEGEGWPFPVNGGDPRRRFRIGDYAGTEPPHPTEYRDEKDPGRTWSILVWRKYASPVWMDIRMTDVLAGHRDARVPADERHICPLQLQVIARAIHLWSNPGDLVADPFVGIGSVPYVALDLGRRGWGCDLKESYLQQARANLEIAAGSSGQMSLFGS